MEMEMEAKIKGKKKKQRQKPHAPLRSMPFKYKHTKDGLRKYYMWHDEIVPYGHGYG